jgi:hypothetical protein
VGGAVGTGAGAGSLTSGPALFNYFQNEFQTPPNLKFITEAFPCSKYAQTLHEPRLEDDE